MDKYLMAKEKIIWAMDPMQDPREAKNLIVEMRSWASRLNCEIQPVAVFSEVDAGFTDEIRRIWKEKYEREIESVVKRYLKKCKMTNTLATKKIFIASRSHRKMAQALAQYAVDTGAMMIFANTRAHRTWNPLRLGGFVETLVTISRTPVLFLNAQAKPSKSTKEILFPTDFSRHSKNALRLLAPWARTFGSKVTLFNQVEEIVPYSFEYVGDTLITQRSLFQTIKAQRVRNAKNWLHPLQQDGIQAEAIVQYQRKSTGQDIVDYAQKNNCNLIALSHSSGSVSEIVFGSVGRDVLQRAKCPVLIFYRPKALPQVAQKSEVKLALSPTLTKELAHS